MSILFSLHCCLLFCLAGTLVTAKTPGPEAGSLPRLDALVGSGYVRMALECRLRGDYESAERLLEKAVLYRDTVSRRRLLADLAERRGDLAGCLRHLHRARELQPSYDLARRISRVTGWYRRKTAPRVDETITSQKTVEKEKKQEAKPSDDVDSFVDGLSSASSLVKRESIAALVRLGRKDKMNRIIRLIDDMDPLVRLEVVAAVGSLASKDSLERLCDRLLREKDDLVVDSILSVVRGMADQNGIDRLDKVLENLDVIRYRRKIIDLLNEIDPDS